MCAALGITDEQTLSPTIAAVRALNILVHDARDLIPIAEAHRRRQIAQRLNTIASQLDACRTRLVQEGPDYIETAWAWVDSGRLALANYRLVLVP
jgi:hypothetical protein